MTNTVLLALLVCHLLGDFYFQPSRSSRFNLVRRVPHNLIYALPYAVLLIYLAFGSFDSSVALFVLAPAALRLMVDTFKRWSFGEGLFKEKHVPAVFVADQLLLLVVILMVANHLHGAGAMQRAADENGLLFWRLAFFTLALGKPTNIVFTTLLGRFAEGATAEKAAGDADGRPRTEDGAGAVVGILERLVMGAFACIGQFAAMGIIMAAKTLARYSRISESPRFAEYYLIGTLHSILAVIILFLLTFGWPH